jgi:hypothetical protein
MNLREIEYTRHEHTRRDEGRKNNLLMFVYDIPYFPACGVFPPLHILNQVFSAGGNVGGMGPGATWKGFTISPEEYGVLVRALKETPISKIQLLARFAMVPMKLDPSFDHFQDQAEWMKAVCEKHRKEWHAALRETGFLS